MQHLIPLKVTKDNLPFYNTTQGAYFFGLIGHASVILVFWYLGVKEMFWFNALVSVPSFIVAIVMNRLGRHNLAFSFAFFELLFHQLVGIHFLGWDFGFQYWLIYLAGLSFFNPRWNSIIQYLLLFIIAASYIIFFIIGQEGVYQFEVEVTRIAYLSSAIPAIAALCLLINYFSKSYLKAQKNLEAEKEVTEQKNLQLTQQHESLLIEQEKTNRLLNKVESLFGQQVSQEVAQTMIHSETEIDSKLYEATIMFLDIRDFTVFADSREPAEVATFQNTVFSALIEIVKMNKGVVNQILGDGILAVFGVPVEDENHAEHAVAAGFAMLEKIKELGVSGKIPPIRIGIGLNSGKIMAGNVGNEIRKFYSLTGTTVIIAARIEQLNKRFNSQFLISEQVYASVKNNLDSHEIEDLGKIELKGIGHEVDVYQLG